MNGRKNVLMIGFPFSCSEASLILNLYDKELPESDNLMFI